MLWWMLRVDSWLDVASLENVENDHSFLFLKKNLMMTFFWTFEFFLFFWKILEILNFLKELKILIDDFFFFFGKIWKSWIFSRNWKFWLIFFFKQPKKYESNAPSLKALYWKFPSFFFFEKPILWMRITLAGS